MNLNHNTPVTKVISLVKCEHCQKMVEWDDLNEGDECSDCYEARSDREMAYWKPLYDGEKLAGLLDQKYPDTYPK